MFKEFISRLTSRKFIIAVASFIIFVLNEQYTEALGVVLAFIGIEGTADAIARQSQKKE